MAMLHTKAETLQWLSGHVNSARVLPLIYFEVEDWRRHHGAVLDRLAAHVWTQSPIIVRSSARSEDQANASLAGRYTSIPNVLGRDAWKRAIDAVIASYGDPSPQDQVLVQPMLSSVRMSGVAFSRDINTGSPYVVVNYSTRGDTDAVTSGHSNELKVFWYWKSAKAAVEGDLAAVIQLMDELETLTGLPGLDVEFAIDSTGLVLLQARPLAMAVAPAVAPDRLDKALGSIAEKIARGCRPHPHLHGARTVYGVMPDWNPAEIIGIRPRPLALSLYRNLITDATWAYQRNNYGYKNLRSFPLLVHFHGLPYIDVRVSFNSFLPRNIEGELAERLLNHYIDRLIETPTLHDKVEFEIIFSCYTLDLPERLKALPDFTATEARQIEDSLRQLTNRIIHRDNGLWRADRERLEVLEKRHRRIMASDLDPVSRIYWLLEDCRRYGTLPFAGLARAGFIAVQLLRSLSAVGVLNEEEIARFLSSLDSVSSQMGRDYAHLPRSSFLSKYGHLRPGTYDILQPRYDEAPDLYFDWTSGAGEIKRDHERFSLSLDQMRTISRLLAEHGLEHDVVGLFDFLQAGIEGREYAKFLFSRNLSDAMALFVKWGQELGFSAEELSYADIGVIAELHASSSDPQQLLAASIRSGEERYAVTRHLNLPPLITKPEDVFAFHLPPVSPNYITQKSATGPVRLHKDRDALKGAILLIPSADPGYDWIFSHGIVGFITAYGGANSHMAIRAAELGIPAVIGCGEQLFNQWSIDRVLKLDCANRQVLVLS